MRITDCCYKRILNKSSFLWHIVFWIVVLNIFGSSAYGQEFAAPRDFTEAKKILNRIHASNRVTFYCRCAYRPEFRNGKFFHKIDPESCAYVPRVKSYRSERMEWEHIVPVHSFGSARSCWIRGSRECDQPGRNCCERTDPEFNKIKSDMHNLQPAIGEINADRSNFDFSEWNDTFSRPKQNQYGGCEIRIDFRNKKVQPPGYVRGDIARTYFYMIKRYGIRVDKSQLILFIKWNKEDPPDEWEITRNKKIAMYQGNENWFITDYEILKDNLKPEDF